ncbi:DinB family protein [Kitasatospora sp. NPDC101183]|uniref:DinB family protein n=1 Tax=Kitasatospora sp. NPDC101183 TaxID=3364100 RepID=UPI0037FC1B94
MNDDIRTEPPHLAGDRASLVAFLDYQRRTLAWKCSALSPEQLRARAVPPSGLSLLGLVRHAAEVERSWFRNVVNGEDVPAFWPRRADGEFAEFDVEGADVDEAFRIWEAACARSREIVDGIESLDAPISWREETFSLRYILTHMIEEYARHNGHADLLREILDGSTGE